MKNAFIFHGAYGSPNENWFPWLKTELAKNDFTVYVPKFPTPKGQSLDSWMKVFSNHLEKINSETIFVGHSLGPAFILHILEQLDSPIKASFFVSGFINKLDNPEFDDINSTFIDHTFNWNTIKQNCKRFILFHGSNDPYVSISVAEHLAKTLEVELNVIKEGGHLNTKSGYSKFDQLLQAIITMDT